MGWLGDELIARAGSDSEAEVKAAAKRWRTRIDPIMRELTALKLTVENDRASIVIHIHPGLPIALQQLDLQVNEVGETLLGIFQPDLAKFVVAGDQITRLLERLDKYGDPYCDTTEENLETIQQAIDLVKGLNDKASKEPFLTWLFQYDEDILGVYKYAQGGFEGEIELYWGVIGAVAHQLNLPVSILTVLTLIHEMAHAYSHLGADIEGRRWSSYSFSKSAKEVKEGLAQYYSYLIAKRLHERDEPRVLSAYEKLLEYQSPVYHTHKPWLQEYSPEIIRAAMLESRIQGDGVPLETLERSLSQAAERLLGVR